MTGLRANSKIIGSFRKLKKIDYFVRHQKLRLRQKVILIRPFFEKNSPLPV